MPYGTGFKPFNHDKSRGKWSHPTDFLFTCIGHAFKADTILFLPVELFGHFGFHAIIPYLLIMAVYTVPIIFIQSFLGQFSGTGFISVFRIAPLFKGVGYVSLAVNLITLAYYSIFSAIPLIFLFYIMRPTIPWSCEGAKQWMIQKYMSTCNYPNRTDDEDHNYWVKVPSVEFFKTNIDFKKHIKGPGFSWLMFMCTFLVWIIVAFIAMRPIKTIGRFARYSCCAVLIIMCVMLLRFLLLPGALNGLLQFFQPLKMGYGDPWIMFPLLLLSTLGPGWGSIITMASFNDFKTNIYSFSWIASLVQLGIFLGMAFLPLLMFGYLFTPFGGDARLYTHSIFFYQFLIIPTGLTFMEVPHFWSFLFFVMLFSGSLYLLVVQLISVLTTLFDEYEALRAHKKTVTLVTVAILATSSIFFCSNHGLGLIILLTKSSSITRTVLNLLLILVVLWIYGRERFQKDVMFMTSRLYSKLMVNVVRFVTPLILILDIVLVLGMTVNHYFYSFSFAIILTMAALAVVPWCLIPGYCIYKVMQTSGRFSLRMKRCVRPIDWYPADPMYKQRYEETISNPELSHQLTNPREEGVNDFLIATAPA